MSQRLEELILAKVGETWTVKYDLGVPARLCITTAGGTVIRVPLHPHSDIEVTVGADMDRIKFDMDVDGAAQLGPRLADAGSTDHG